jgi:hypothetical protein
LNLNAQAPAPAPAPASKFVNLDVTNPTNAYYGQLLSQNGVGSGFNGALDSGSGWNTAFMNAAGGAGYGTFKYGQAMPMPGTQQYRDMQEYLSYGGADPYNLYGSRGSPAGMYVGGPGVSVGDGVGVAGSAASVGSSANF